MHLGELGSRESRLSLPKWKRARGANDELMNKVNAWRRLTMYIGFSASEHDGMGDLKMVIPASPNDSEESSREVDISKFILIVDDDPDILDVTSLAIETEGMAVEIARNGKEALVFLGAGKLPKLVLLDLMMPVMNGWEFLAVVAKDPSLKEIPVVVLTAAEHAEVPGAMEVLSKPMDLIKLLRVVERYVCGDGV